MIRKAENKDLHKIIKLYIDTTDFLEKNINYPNWRKYQYPNEETAQNAIKENSLYIYEVNQEIFGSVILNQHQPKPYKEANWLSDFEDNKILTIHTLLVHPLHTKKGIGKEFILYAEKLGKEKNFMSIRLDTYSDNTPAQNLYENNGYVFCGKINLKPDRSAKLYNTYEKLL